MKQTKIWKDFDTFSRGLIASKDVDPTYPFIKKLVEIKNYEPEWFTFIYVMFYNLETAIKICDEMPDKDKWDEDLFRAKRLDKSWNKFGHERRGNARNVDNQVEMVEAIIKFIKIIEVGDKLGQHIIENNSNFRSSVELLPQHGGWASFKIAEIFEKSLDYTELNIPDLGLSGRSPNKNDGPIGGLRWLFGRDEKYNSMWFGLWNKFGFRLAEEWGVDIGEVETCLCKFHKLMTGKYFIGHDIIELNELHHSVLSTEDYEKCMSDFDVRFWYMGINSEFNKCKKIYKDNQCIVNEEFKDAYPKLNIKKIMLTL